MGGAAVVGSVLGLLAQSASAGSQEVAWTGFGVTAGFIGYLTGVVIREKDRQIEKLSTANESWSTVLQTRLRERDELLARTIESKDAQRETAIKEAHEKFDKALRAAFDAFAVQVKEREERYDRGIATLEQRHAAEMERQRDLFEGRHKGRRPAGEGAS